MPVLLDLKYALRLLARSPAFTALTVIVLAGGAAVGIFTHSFLNTVMFKPLPIADGRSVVKVFGSYQGQRRLLDALELAQIRAEVAGLDELGAYTDREVMIAGQDASRAASATYTEWNMFEFSRMQPALGRGLQPRDNRAGAEPVAVLSHKLWQNAFAGAADIVGRVVRINSVATRIVGVMPEGYAFPVSSDIWLPISERLLQPIGRGEAFLKAYARVRPESSVERVNAELSAIVQRVAARFPAEAANAEIADGGFVTSFQEAQIPDALPVFIALYVVAGFILLLACINVGNLLLARTNSRIREISIRVALGASRLRLMFQMMWESILIGLAGGVLGLLLAGWALEALNLFAQSRLEGGLAFWWRWGMDGQTIIAAVVVLLATIGLAGGIPAWRATNGDFNAVLKDGTPGAQGRQAGRISRALVVVEVVLISVVVFLGGILALASYQVTQVDSGMNTRDALAAPVVLSASRYDEPAAQLRFFRRLKFELAQANSIRGALVMAQVGNERNEIALEGVEYQLETDYPQAYVRALLGSPELLGIRVLEGRVLDEGDRETGALTAVVSESFAARHWPGGNALGSRVRLAENEQHGQWRTVVGVVSDVLSGDPMSKKRSKLTLYLPLAQLPTRAANVVLKHRGDEAAARFVLYDALSRVDPEVFPEQVMDFEESLSRINLIARSATDVLVQSGLFALLLAVTGIYGLTANSVTRRTQEIGVRRALGATDGNIIRLLMRQGSRQLVLGLFIGVVIAALASLLFSRILAISNALYLVAGVLVPVLISTVVLLAIYLPTRQAVRLEPSAALRYQ